MYRKRQEPTDLKELAAELLPRLYNTARYLAGNSDRAAMNAGATPLARGAAATALARIDPPGAVRMLLNGFSQIPEKDRLQLVEILGDFIGGKEAREQLEAIAGSDPSERVRKAASSHAAR
jgi:hypothetical protein